MKTADCVTGAGFLGLSAWFYFAAKSLPESFSYGDPGPAELPKLIAIICAVAAVALIVKGAVAAAEAGKEYFPVKGLLFVGWTILAAVGIFYLGTLPALAAYIFGGILIQVGRASWPLALLCAVAITGLIYALFKLLLGVPLP